jgi:Zn-dependent protease
LIYGAWLRFGHPGKLHGAVTSLLTTTIMMNVGLAIFNMLPIPPLDGSRVVDGWMPAKWERTWERYCRHASWVLLAIIVMPRVMGISILTWPMERASSVAFRIADVVAGDAVDHGEDDFDGDEPGD